jgi:TolB protein
MKGTKFSLILLIAIFFASCNDTKNKNTDSHKGVNEYAIIYNVLVNDSTDNYDVFKIDMDGSNKKNITNLPGVEWSYISEKDEVLFISDKDTCHRCFRLYQSNFKGENLKKISDILLSDSWMSSRNNGKELIIKPKADSTFNIIDFKGNILSRVETGLPYSSDPLFVNDGKQIVFRGGKTKSKLLEGFNEELYLIDENGKNRKQLTTYPENDTTAGKFGYKAGTPKLHPTEKYITYQSKQNGKYSLYAVSLDGQKQWKLTDNRENEGWHDWSPDGKWLAIELFDDDQTQFNIGLMNWETKEMKILTDSTYRYQQCPNFVIKN